MSIVATTGLPIGVHCENQEIIDATEKPFREKQHNDYKDFNYGRDQLAEVIAGKDTIAIAKKSGARLHIVHTSAPEVVEEAFRAKCDGFDITVETCPHFLTLSIDDINKLGPFGICAPPIRSSGNVKEMWRLLKEKKIDVIGSDHATYTFEEKENYESIWDIPLGLTSIQTMLPLILSEAILKKKMPIESLVALISSKTAKTFGLFPRKGFIGVGSDADLCFIDPNTDWEIKKHDLFYKMKWSPYLGMQLRGKVVHTMVRGSLVYSEGKILEEPGTGKFVSPLARSAK